MDQQTYEITAPNGKVLSITGDHVPTEPELHDIFAKAGVETGAKPNPEPHIGAEPTMLDRAGAAVGPAIRGAGDVTGANWLLEHAVPSLVPPGRLSGPEQNTRDTQTRSTAAVGGVAMMVGQSAESILKAATTKGLSAAGRAVAAARAAGHEVTPVLKYEITKTTLEKIGVPSPIAMGAAILVSGYRGNGKGGAAKPGEVPAPTHEPTAPGYDRYMPNVGGTPVPAAVTPAPAGPVETPAAAPRTAPPPAPAVPAPPAASAAAPSALSPARLANEVALQARRQSVQLSPAEDTAAQTLVRDHGASPADAVATVKAGRDLPTKLTLTPEEATQYQALKQQGKSGGEAEAAILKLRSLTKKLKTPSTSAVDDAVRRRNETGRWED